MPAGGVAINPAGTNVYVTNEVANSVSVISTASNTVTASIGVGSFPTGVVVNSAGTQAYVGNFGNNTVSVIDTASNTVTATIAGFAGPFGLSTPSSSFYSFTGFFSPVEDQPTLNRRTPDSRSR